MDFVIKHWGPFVRRYPLGLPLASSDYLANKRNTIEQSFKTCNFSLILRGQGTYERNGNTWTVQSPCVIAQWPGETLRYGPDESGWAEWYFVYPRALFQPFRQRRLIDPALPVWPIADLLTVQLCLSEFTAHTRCADPSRVVDLVDRLAERVILATWHYPGAPWCEDVQILAIAREMRENPSRQWDFSRLASENGYSLSTFRRRWVDLFECPPVAYLRQLRISEACRLLVETQIRIKEIANRVGFDDELYFSRRFCAATGYAPRDYRKTYRQNH